MCLHRVKTSPVTGLEGEMDVIRVVGGGSGRVWGLRGDEASLAKKKMTFFCVWYGGTTLSLSSHVQGQLWG
jgi:hypothetical protein